MADIEQELLALNQRLLEAIAKADWAGYSELCDPSLTAFEPEARGQLVTGLAFHNFYFDLGPPSGPRLVTMTAPHVRVIGDAAIVSYVRLNQKRDAGGIMATHAFEETRIWQKKDGRWRHIHFHRSAIG